MQKGKHYSIFVYFFSFYPRQFLPPWDLQYLFRQQFHWFIGGAALRRILASILLLTEHGKTCQTQIDQTWGPRLPKDLKPDERS